MRESQELNLRRRRTAGVGTWVVSIPSFADLSAFSAITGALAVAGGGVRASFDNVFSTGKVPFPATVDTARPFHCGALFEYNGDARTCTVQLTSDVDSSFLGINFSIDSGELRATSGIASMFRLLTGLTAGDRFWLGVSWDATGTVSVFCTFDVHGGFNNPDTYQGPVHFDYVKQIDKAYTDGALGHGTAFQGINSMLVATSSTTTKVLAMFARQGDFLSGPADRFEPPLLLNPTIAGDTTTLLRAPEWKPALTPTRDLVVLFHGAGSSEATGSVVGSTDDGAAIAGLVEAGYMVAIMRGTNDGVYGGANASNFGAPTQLATWWRAFVQDIRRKVPIRNLYLVGLSMGLTNALRYYAAYPEDVKAIVGISGLCNLTYAYNSEGFAALINAAYGTGTAAAIAAYDPKLTPALFTSVPIKLWHGSADATLSKAQHMDAFAAAVNALSPGRVATVNVVGADHLTAACFDAAAILAFLQANP